jgi:hypothetical protein
MSNDPQITTCDLRVPSLRLEDRALVIAAAGVWWPKRATYWPKITSDRI